METMNSLREYTQNHVNPLLKPKLQTSPKFIPEMIPTFSVKKVALYLSQIPAYQDFDYKDATLNPTNPEDLADDFETKLVRKFQSNSELLEMTSFRSSIN